jgi:hypothetical protein
MRPFSLVISCLAPPLASTLRLGVHLPEKFASSRLTVDGVVARYCDELISADRLDGVDLLEHTGFVAEIAASSRREQPS